MLNVTYGISILDLRGPHAVHISPDAGVELLLQAKIYYHIVAVDVATGLSQTQPETNRFF